MTEQEIKLNILNKLGSAPLKYMDEVYQWVIGELKLSNRSYFAGLSSTELCIVDNYGKEVIRTPISEDLDNILTILKKCDCRVLCENDSTIFIDFIKKSNETYYLVRADEININYRTTLQREYGISLVHKMVQEKLGDDDAKALAIINLNKSL